MIKTHKFKTNVFKLLVVVVLVYGSLFVYREQVDRLNPAFLLALNTKDRFNPDLKGLTIDRSSHVNNIDIYHSGYSSLFRKMDINGFVDLPVNEKCDLFFQSLFTKDKNWHNDPQIPIDFHKEDFVTYGEFVKKKIKKEKESIQKLNKDTYGSVDDVPDNKVMINEVELKAQYLKHWEQIYTHEQLLHDYLATDKLYHHCYVENTHSILNQTQLVERVFPWLTQDYPTIEDDKGRRLRIHDDYPDKNFLYNLKSNLKGKGIVLTISDGHLDDTLRLFRLLRYHDTELPIQIVYFSNLSKESKTEIITYATQEILYGGKKLIPLQVQFVDVNSAVKKPFLHKFNGFGNKILATMFNTFQEMILIDADSVILTPPEQLFNLNKYQVNGTVFFKDRKAVEYRPKHDVTFFKKMLPSKLDSLVFGFNQPTNYSLEREFFQGLNHYMESGLVVINRITHFFQPFIMAELNFHSPVTSRLYGDKELFWLALVLNGEENYSFNEHFLAAIGQLTPVQERRNDIKKAKDFRSQEVCSNHPSHINDEDNRSLLWFNSGFRHCGQDYDYEQEFGSKKRYTNIKTAQAFKTFFDNKLIITHAVIPPSKALEVDNTDGESTRAWVNLRQYCNGYTWCAYSSIGESPTPEQKGLLIEYSKEEQAKFAELGDVWMSVEDPNKTSQSQSQSQSQEEPQKDKTHLANHNPEEVNYQKEPSSNDWWHE